MSPEELTNNLVRISNCLKPRTMVDKLSSHRELWPNQALPISLQQLKAETQRQPEILLALSVWDFTVVSW